MVAQRTHYSVAIVTAPRTPATLPATLESLRAAGWWTLNIFCDHFPPEKYRWPKINLREYEEKKFGESTSFFHRESGGTGPLVNWLETLTTLTSNRCFDREWLLICEDDIEVTAGLRRWLGENPPPDDGVVSLYTAAPNHNAKGGWHRTDVPRRAYGALAYLIPRKIALHMANRPPWAPPPNHLCTDHAVGRWCRDHGVPYYCHSPSLVRHTGEFSALPPAGLASHRQCAAFARDTGELVSMLAGVLPMTDA